MKLSAHYRKIFLSLSVILISHVQVPILMAENLDFRTVGEEHPPAVD